MNNTKLKKIISDKYNWILYQKKKKPLVTFQNKITTNTRNFYHALNKKKLGLILECKRSSPSLGEIRKDFNLIEISNIYKKYASVISVVTDEKHFCGNLKFIKIVRKNAPQPILCKDFFIDAYQIYLARYYQADAILLMLSILDDQQYAQFFKIAKKLNMGVLTEVSNHEEVKRAIKLNAKIIGINNRNLHDLSIDLNKTCLLSRLIPNNITIISESGIKKYRQIKQLKKFVHGFLIGSYLMSKKNLETAIRSVIFGKNKICGLTRSIDIEIAEKYGFIYGGLIFVHSSPRNITYKQAKNILINKKLKYIGVFQNENIKVIANIAEMLSLHAIQLHGVENQKYINILRKILPEKIKIWKVYSITSTFPKMNYINVNKYVFDACKTENHTPFDWSILHHKILDNVILSGGINSKNCILASQLNCSGLDLNSGVEKFPGVKDENKIKLILNQLKYS